MIKDKLNKYIGALSVGVAVMAIPACSDSWDEHYAEMTDPTATKTLWEQICENPNLTKFRSIAENTKYYRDDVHPVEGYTYADILNGNLVATVWAPEDNSISDAEYQELMRRCQEEGYNMHAHFMSNHIALFRHNLSGDSVVSIKTINRKKMEFDKSKAKFQGISINERNIPASNGLLHTITGVVPFKYNFYQFLKYGQMTDSVSAYVMARDTTYFVEYASIEGPTNADGNPEYVDSVYYTSNRMIDNSSYWPSDETEKKTWLMPEKGFNAQLTVEDSTFVMIIPSDKALAEAKAKLKPFYTYSTAYADESTYTEGAYTKGDEITGIDTASVSENSLMMDILTPTVFNIHKQFAKDAGLTNKALTMEEFLEGKAAKYYFNTYGDTLRSIGDWEQASLFANADTVKMSNGYAYIVDSWNFPTNYYKPNIYVELTGRGNLFNLEKTLDPSDDYAGRIQLNSEKYKDVMEAYGTVSRSDFMVVEPSKEANKVTIQIPLYTNTDEGVYNPKGEVMSGKYDIYMVRVPSWYAYLGSDNDTLFFNRVKTELGEDSIVFNTSMIDSLSNLSQNKLDIRIFNNTGQSNGQPKATTKQTLDIAVGKLNAGIKGWDIKDAEPYKLNAVDTILIAKDYEFPFSYKNIRSNKTQRRKSFPYLEIKSNASTTNLKPTTDKTTGRVTAYTNGFNIDRIILVSKETGMETPIVVKN